MLTINEKCSLFPVKMTKMSIFHQGTRKCFKQSSKQVLIISPPNVLPLKNCLHRRFGRIGDETQKDEGRSGLQEKGDALTGALERRLQKISDCMRGKRRLGTQVLRPSKSGALRLQCNVRRDFSEPQNLGSGTSKNTDLRGLVGAKTTRLVFTPVMALPILIRSSLKT